MCAKTCKITFTFVEVIQEKLYVLFSGHGVYAIFWLAAGFCS